MTFHGKMWSNEIQKESNGQRVCFFLISLAAVGGSTNLPVGSS